MAIVLIWAVAPIVFLAIRFVPGDPAELLLAQGGVAPDPAAVTELHSQLGLDQPLVTQYFTSFGHLLSGDLGHSLQDGAPVSHEIARRLPRTLELILVAAIIAVLVGIPGGALAATYPRGMIDRFGTWVSAVGLAVPVFVAGTLLVLLFAQTLRWVPAGGYVPLAEDPLRHFALLAMPAFTIALGLAAVVFRMTRASVLDVTQKRFRAHRTGERSWLRRASCCITCCAMR